jgi:general secretion pathway protein K
VSRARLTSQLIALTFGPQYEPLFSSEDADGQRSDRQDICAALIDWTDSDQDLWACDGSATAQGTAPEDSFYERLDQPYTRKNAPFDSLLELYKVRGVGEDYWSTFIEQDPDDPSGRVMTVWGQGTVNVNSANPQVLLAVICQYAEPGTKICDGADGSMQLLSMLSLLRGVTQGAPLFGSPQVFVTTLKGGGMLGPMLLEAGIVPPVLTSESLLKESLTTESKVFSIYAKGVVRSGKRESTTRIHAVVDFRQAPPPAEVSNVAEAQEVAEQQAAIQAALKPSAAGSIVYYRVD